MKRYKSEQSKILRRRLTLNTIVAWVIYTVIFIALALAANATVVPALASYIVSQTSTTVYLNGDEDEYLGSLSFSGMFDDFYSKIADKGNDVGILEDNTYEMDEVVSENIASLARSHAQEAEGSSEDKTRLKTDAENDLQTANGNMAVNQKAAGAQAEGSTGDNTDSAFLAEARSNTFGDDWKNIELGQIIAVDKNGQTNVIVVTPSSVAKQRVEDQFAQLQSDGGSWDLNAVPYSDPQIYEARELSAYNAFRSLKIPVAFLIYIFGCLILVFAELRRSLRYFDELSRAVANLLSDRTKPVKLPSDLAIAQNELNNIRIEALSDERAAKAAEQRKNELVAYLAHDIRTPLTSVIGYLSLLDEAPDLPARSREKYTHIAMEKAERLESLIEEFFEITRYNLQSIPIERNNVDVRLFLQQIADEFYPQAIDKDIEIEVEAPSRSFFVDAEKLARAIGNVIRNAITFANEETTVQIRAAQANEGAHSSGWVISITDEGREISPAHLESIFEKFYREDGARSAKSGGAGLGLAIAKEIIASHGGTISATSENGTTTFTVELP